MPDIIKVEYEQSGHSTSNNDMGMREMQARAYEKRGSKYLLIKAPPASGKSRALMFIGLDKLHNQGVKKVIVAVPERSIGASFGNTELAKFGFFTDWVVNDRYNLCTPGSSESKVNIFKEFLLSDERVLVCTHATLRFAFEGLDNKSFDDCLVAIDEFHHVSADEDNKLGEVIKGIMADSSAHIVAMTGSYFRGDSVPVLLPSDEAKFDKVTYNYYDQLNGYDYLKSLGIGYHFYQGNYLKKVKRDDGAYGPSALAEILDTDKKTILHIPSVNSGESTKDKREEVGRILDAIGEVVDQDSETGVINVRRSDGKMLKVADLVEDDPKQRNKIVEYLRNIESPDDMDLIIALGMAKEGFDWPYCEHALTVGYRSSLTEIIQIIGRATRDSDNKTHAQFTNLIAQPDVDDDSEVRLSVNNMLKAISASLLMEQVLAPNFKFKTKVDEHDVATKGEIKIRGLKEPSEKVNQILESDLNDLKAAILQDDTMLKAMPGNVDPEVMNKVLVPKVIREKYPDLSEDEVEQLRQQVVTDSVIKNGEIVEQGDKRFVTMAGKFVNIDDINIDLIDTVNPFQKAYEILSKSVTTHTLGAIKNYIDVSKMNFSEEEAVILWPKIQQFIEDNNKEPDVDSADPLEQRMAYCIKYLQKVKKEREQADK